MYISLKVLVENKIKCDLFLTRTAEFEAKYVKALPLCTTGCTRSGYWFVLSVKIGTTLEDDV